MSSQTNANDEAGPSLSFWLTCAIGLIFIGYFIAGMVNNHHAEVERYQRSFENQCTDAKNELNDERNICYSKPFQDKDGEWHVVIVSIKSIDETWTDPDTEFGGGQ